MTWNPRSAASWAELLGMVSTPMFGAARTAENAGEHSIILDGVMGSFSLSVGNADEMAKAENLVSWSWSANVLHSAIVDQNRNVFLVRRWDEPDKIQEYKLPDVTQARLLPDRFQSAERPTLPSVINRSINAFRFVRNGVRQMGGGDVDAIRLFNTILMWAEVVRESEPEFVPGYPNLATVVPYLRSRGLLNYDPSDFSRPVRSYPIPEATDLLLKGIGNERYLLDADLLVRHAGGTLFQEAHIEIDEATQPQQRELFGALWSGDGPVNGKPKDDAHFTPPSLARLLAELALSELARTKEGLPDSIAVLDPACGSGVFFTELIRSLSDSPVISLDLHGIDNTAVSRIMSEFNVRRTLAELSPKRPFVIQIMETNSLQVSNWGQHDIIMMNPPFTAWNAMSSEERTVTKDVLGEMYSDKADSSLAFVVKAVRSLRPGSVLATVVPAAFLESKAAKKFRRTVLEASDISIRLIGRFRGWNYFRNAIVEPAFIVLSRTARQSSDTIRFVLADSGSEEKAIRAVRSAKDSEDTEGDGFEIYHGSYDLISSASWMPRPRRGANLLQSLSVDASIATVGTLFKTFLGVRPGLKSAFMFPANKLKRLAPTPEERRFFRPVADTINHAKVFVKTWIFYPYFANGELAIRTEEELARLVPTFYRERLLPERDKLATRKSLRHRAWWELVEPRPTWQGKKDPKIVTQAFGKKGAFAYDSTGRFVVVQGVAWMPHDPAYFTEDMAWAYVAIANSEPFERLLDFFCPKVGGGQYEVYPKYIDQVPIPDLTMLRPTMLARLAKMGRLLRAGRIELTKLSSAVCAAYGVKETVFRHAIPVTDQEKVGFRFAELTRKWKKETGMSSSPNVIFKHPSYQAIIAMGEKVLPYILSDMQQNQGHWFVALEAITKQNPVPAEHRTNGRLAREAWLKWGKTRDLIG